MSHQNHTLTPPPDIIISEMVDRTLKEDLGLRGDITTDSIFSANQKGQASITAREEGIVSGLPFAINAFHQLDKTSEIFNHKSDGQYIKAGDKIATINASVRTILTAERTALNFLGHLSGIATLTNKYVESVKNTKAIITDTRKTTPTLRAAEKYAIRCGGGVNHRFRLDDAVLIKDNHIAYAGGIEAAIEKVRSTVGHMIKIEVEVDTLEQLKHCLNHHIDAVLLDNMTIDELKQAVSLIDGKIISEASGGVNLDTVSSIADTGVDIISVGALTHSAPTLDIGLDIEITSET